MMHNYNEDFKKCFPPFTQLKPIQEKAVRNVVEKNNTLCIMPTGEGKSFIYWLSAIELGGTCLVISPLTSLISEQAEKIRAYGYEVIECNGSIPAKQQMKFLLQFGQKEITPQFIFASPEKIATDGLFECALQCRHNDIKLVVIDEVHCVSQWGLSFRPFYQQIPAFLNKIFPNGRCRILALTATLNPKEVADICENFRITGNDIIKKDILMRNEIQLHVNKYANEDDKTEKLWDILKIHSTEKILVYVYRKYYKRGVEDLCNQARDKGYRATFFHGDMDAETRNEIIRQFKDDELNVVFATNAFGMGIDIPDIRVVVHFMLPESVEQYYQEIGRAARDGKGANAYLLYSEKNIDVKKKFFIDGSFPDAEKLRKTYKKFATKVGYVPLPYFEDEDIQTCLPYYIQSGNVEIVGKGFADLTFIDENRINDSEIEQYYKSTKTKGYVRTLKKNDIEPEKLSGKIYSGMIDKKIYANRPPERWIILKVNKKDLDLEDIGKIEKDISNKKDYKHDLLSYFIKLISDDLSSSQLHQEIAAYLGMDKHQLNRIYETLDHNHVRSKSEVIISNLLYNNQISYQYEQKLYYDGKKYIEPDFTIQCSKGTLYWEHVGMLGKSDYDESWSHKVDIYKKYYPGQLVITYETGNLSNDAAEIINKIKQS